MKTVRIITIGGLIIGMKVPNDVTVVTESLIKDYKESGEDDEEDRLESESFAS